MVKRLVKKEEAYKHSTFHEISMEAFTILEEVGLGKGQRIPCYPRFILTRSPKISLQKLSYFKLWEKDYSSQNKM